MTKQEKNTVLACFLTSASCSATGNLSPLLFLTFRQVYGLSYSLLGLLIVVNFGTQLLFDLLFSFFWNKLPVKLSTRMTPVTIAAGMLLCAAAPILFPKNIFLGLVLGTVVFSCGSGLSEVLTSPTVGALPSKDPEKLLSALHSCYAWGVVAVVGISTAFLALFGMARWQFLYLLFSLPPIAASLFFLRSSIPDVAPSASSSAPILKNRTLLLATLCIFLGGASECTMAQWCSLFLEQSLGVSKTVGDLCGVALFGATLGAGRTLYAKYGKNITRILIFGSLGAFFCYAVAALSPLPVIGLVACVLTGFCVSMLWPGTLIAASNRVADGGVAMYALLAAGGDLGASVCPQLVGILSDAALVSKPLLSLAEKLSLSPDRMALRFAILCASLIPLLGVLCFAALAKKPKLNGETSV